MDATVSIYFGGSATDVTDRVRSVSLRRGRSRELDTFTSGQCSFTLDNRDREFDPLNTSSTYYGQLRPRLRVTVVSDSISLFDGFIEDWNFGYDLSGDSLAEVTCIDGLALLSQTTLNEVTNPQDTPGERIQRLVDRSEVGYSGSTNLDAGFTFLQADTISEDTNTLSYLQQIATTDFGRLFVDGAGFLRYRDRTAGLLEPARVVFTEQGLSFPDEADDSYIGDFSYIADDVNYKGATFVTFSGVGLEYGSEFLFNRVSASRANGSTVDADNSSSQSTYGIRTLSQSNLLFNSDADTEQFAIYLADLYGEPDVRIVSHEVLLESLTALRQIAVKEIEIGDVVRTVWKPNGIGDAIDRNSIVEGIEHRLAPDRHLVRLQLTPFDESGFILDSATLGLLDTSEVTY